MSTPPLNPYRPPSAEVADIREPASSLPFGVPGRRVDAGRGAGWISEGWSLFKMAPGMWIVVTLIFFAVSIGISLVPFFGSIANYLLGPVFMVGLLSFAHGLAGGEEADVGKLFIGFREKLGPLVVVGVLYLLMILGVVVICGVLVFVTIGASAFSSGNPEQVMGSLISGGGGLGLLLVGLVFLGLLGLVMAAYWFAPGLVFFADLGAIDALKASFAASFRNFLPLFIYGILLFLVMLLGTLAVVIGLIVAIPVMSASYYASFRDIFGQR